MSVVFRNIITTSLFIIIGTWCSAQIKLNGKSVICEGDLGTFSFTVPTGKTVTDYDWDFGDTYTSTKATPTHLFKTQGKYTVKLKVTYVSSQTENFSLDIDVVALPNAAFQWLTSSDTCHYTNEVCFKDQSTPATSSRAIKKRTYFWGDGRYDESTSIYFGQKTCHSYYVPDSFYVEMEIEDRLGCKASVSRTVVIVPSVVAKYNVGVTYPDCETAVLCLTNTSTTSKGGTASFSWNVNDSSSTNDHFSGNALCYTYTKSTTVKVRLDADAGSGCTDKHESMVPVQLADPNREIELDKTSICYGEKSFVASIDIVSGEKVKWYFNGVQGPNFSSWNYNFSQTGLMPGKYQLSCEVSRGSCKKTYTKWIEIIGPVAGIKVFNKVQCQTNRKVFFVDRSQYFDSSNVTTKWYVWDSKGDNCVINRSANINKNKNCNTTIGWFGKHQFTDMKSNNTLEYIITDTVTGCSDKVVETIDLNACGDCTGGSNNRISLCEDGIFLKNASSGNGNPEKFSLDTGRTWLPFPSKLNGKYSGSYGVGMIFHFKDSEWVEEIGDDSIRVHASPKVYIDTVFVDNLLTVYPTKRDQVSFDFAPSCNPSVAQVHLKSGLFYPGESIYISWGDGTSTSERYQDTIVQILFKHAYYSAGGSGKIKVTLSGTGSCGSSYEYNYTYGHESDFEVIGNPCLNKEMCFKSDVSYYKPEVRWDSINKLGKVRWLLNDKLIDSSYNLCYTFDSIGVYKFDMIAIAGTGCVDTVTKFFHVHDLFVGVKDESKGFFCSGQRTFLDSSFVTPIAGYVSTIDRYYWDFGTGVYSSYEKNPTVAFDGTKKELSIRHMAVSRQGCKAETEFNLRVLTSKPSFIPTESNGCAPFTAVFKNHTIGASQYIWELGDTNNITVEQDSLQDQLYTYHTPGVYYVRLIGIDSFLNTKTGDIETCHTVYPELGKVGIKVRVMPSIHNGISGPDTLCVYDTGAFQSVSFKAFDSEIWRFGDGSNSESTTDGHLNHPYSTPGNYTVSLVPVYDNMTVVPQCISSIEKMVSVVDVTADFTLDPSYEEPEFGFFNYSEPKHARYAWDFGQPSSGINNTSTEFEPSHDYGSDSGQYQVCLVARVASCLDTVCQKITNNFYIDPETVNASEMYNVFTPGNADGKNDVFEIRLNNQATHELIIYNRWGDIVFESYKNQSQNDALDWNGNINNDGRACPSGTYFYLLKYAFNDDINEVITTEGTVTLLRD